MVLLAKSKIEFPFRTEETVSFEHSLLIESCVTSNEHNLE
jgi:hypothetical protein